MRVLSCLLFAASAAAVADPAVGNRGELLYTTHCIECHTTQMHWRSKRLARDWETLRAQVSRWQGEARLGWTEEDIQAVSLYLNETIYRFPRSEALAPADAATW